ncbi:MAG: Asp-tRNA(Asn)/Glu-tRNA(Gln) amidotransferase GatCAB subunit B [Phycisphaeraceae bacterium]|nr:Asp-tRNA(Asn)/Glu-tRNA(Gln) amidotransferase GatCAB subunit B [Phycisphaeraceae bacterium]
MVASYPGLDARLMVGMEIHVELATKTKMFTSVPNVAHPDYHHSEPNSIIDPVVIGMPGVLPVINKAAVDMSIKVGLALGCKIANFTKWDRKSYYYPDLPKNYQISQYDLPICGEGEIEIPVNAEPEAPTKTIRILRAHLEEDAGKLAHEAPGGVAIDHSIVDLNRAGTPLLEIVTYPDFETPDEAVMFGQTLRDIVRHIGVSQGVMQMGHIRFEPNINVIITKDGKTYKTPIAEIKNLNSFKAVYGSIAYEYERQIDEWMQTGEVMGARSKSTRGWDDTKMQTTLQRHKEDEDEYRYFPDPDLVPVTISQEHIDTLRAQLPELPLVKRKRYAEELGLNDKQIDALLAEPATTALFDAVLKTGTSAKRAAAILLNYAAKRANEFGVEMDQLGITAGQIHDIAKLADDDKISSTAAADLFNLCCENPGDSAEELANDHKLIQVSDTGALDAMIDQVVADPKCAKAVEDIKAGKDKAIGMLMGQIMKLSKGSANPKVVTEMIKKKLQG